MDALPLTSAAHNDNPPSDGQSIDTPWDAAKRGAKPEVTAFDGSLDPKRYMDWETGLDEYFEWYQLPEGRRLQFAQMKLTGQARIYWRNTQATMERRHEPAITSWTEMKSRLRDKFVPACYRPMIIDEWQHLRQGEGTVAEYITRFDDLMIRCNLDEEPVATLARFRAGLRPEYQRELVLQEISTLEKAYRYTINMELFSSYSQRTHPPWIATAEVTRLVHANTAGVSPTSLFRVTQAAVTSPFPPRPPQVVHAASPVISPTPGIPGLLGNHTSASTNKFRTTTPPMIDRQLDRRTTGGSRPRMPPASSNNTGTRIACYKCQGWGHFAAQCPSPRQTTRPARALLVEIHDDDHITPPGHDDAVAEIYEADPDLVSTFEGTQEQVGCIIKEVLPLTSEEHAKALTAPLGTTLTDIPTGFETPLSSENPIRTAIFTTFTKIGANVIKILIDSGSVVNAVSAASILSLGLQPQLHPRPYKAMWINDAFLAVTSRCIVPLQVAGYQEEVWCDILPMGVGSVLLGRP